RRGGERAHRDRHVVAAAAPIDHVGEQEGTALILGEAALELPARQRVELAVLVDRPLDAHQQAGRLQRRPVLLEIKRGTGGCTAGATFSLRLIEHIESSQGRARRHGGASRPLTPLWPANSTPHFFLYASTIGLATRKQSTPTGIPQ